MFVPNNNHYHLIDRQPRVLSSACPPFSVIVPFSQILHDDSPPLPPPPFDWKKCLADMDNFIIYLESREIFNELDSTLHITQRILTISDGELEAGYQTALRNLEKDELSERRRKLKLRDTVMSLCDEERARHLELRKSQ